MYVYPVQAAEGFGNQPGNSKCPDRRQSEALITLIFVREKRKKSSYENRYHPLCRHYEVAAYGESAVRRGYNHWWSKPFHDCCAWWTLSELPALYLSTPFSQDNSLAQVDYILAIDRPENVVPKVNKWRRLKDT